MEDFLPKGTIGLSQDTKRRISLILQGTSAGPGCNIRTLKFSNDPKKREDEIQRFLDLSNNHFSGILQFVQSKEYLVPIVINSEAIEIKRRSVSTGTIAIAALILLHDFQFNRGPTLNNLTEKLTATELEDSEINRSIRELRKLRWIERKKEESIEYLNPTPILKACIPLDVLREVWKILYSERSDKERLEIFLPKDYLKIQKNLNFSRLDDFSDLNINAKEEK